MIWKLVKSEWKQSYENMVAASERLNKGEPNGDHITLRD